MEFIKYNEETNDYIPSEIELDANDDRFYINKITKIKNGYTAEIVEYLVDYTDFDNNNIYLKNLNAFSSETVISPSAISLFSSSSINFSNQERILV